MDEIIAVTGHRPQKLGNEYDMKGPVSDYISDQFDYFIKKYDPEEGLSGLALGVDTIWAICILYHGIRLRAAIPFKGQELAWPEKSQRLYHKILNHKLTTVVYVCEPGYESWKMQKRNEYLVDESRRLIAVSDGSPGGTANCIKYAKKVKRQIDYIDPRVALKY